MSAPKGNKYYKRRQKDGRELIFAKPEDLLAKAYEYFRWCSENPWIKKDAIRSGVLAGQSINIKVDRPYTIVGFCVYAEIGMSTFYDYGDRKDFSEVITHIRNVIEQNQLEGAILEAYNPNIVARLLGLSDKRELTGQDGKDLVINVTAPATKDNLEDLKEKLGG